MVAQGSQANAQGQQERFPYPRHAGRLAVMEAQEPLRLQQDHSQYAGRRAGGDR
ncbi:hypothetical protein PR202_gb25581 [Eleusine coracana subsp. coracana]|uniref:Uncharacterized protein n=1 Tax=Eleusine coracana subsp. coracana TaxID=191504 RepID=A0AAV5FPM4_ELECO|nr:hypothetical protein PR202_gb25581 [Eleusine coracana subsp. coracana]